jgi:predicted DNA-binding transcriptional regulator AlpA
MAVSNDPAPTHLPRILSKADAAAYCGVSEKGFDQWVRTGKLPRAMKGTRRWDKVAIDYAIDCLSGVSQNAPPPSPSGLQKWVAERRAQKEAAAERQAEVDRRSLNPQRRRKG